MRIFAIIFYIVLSIFVAYNLCSQKYKIIGNIFQIAVVMSFTYEHGYKIFFKNNEKMIFYTAYLLPLITIILLQIHTAFDLKNILN